VSHAAVHVLIYALAAAASPLVLTATFVVIRSERPRTNGIAFLSGFLIGTTVACGVGLALGQATVERLESHDTVEGALALLLGVALLVVGLRARHVPQRPEAEGSRARSILAALAHVRPAAACSLAGLLGFGGPKRLLLTFLAMASVSEASLGEVADVTLVALYVGVATVLVWGPVGVVIVAGERAAVIIGRSQTWLTNHAVVLRVWLSLGIGAALVVDGLLRLFT
jgi:hypothetical protein